MLEKVHYVAEGTLIYLRETSEVFIRVQKGWRKLQVLFHYTLIFSNFLPHNEGEGHIFTEGEKCGCKDSLFLIQKLLMIQFGSNLLFGPCSLVS